MHNAPEVILSCPVFLLEKGVVPKLAGLVVVGVVLVGRFRGGVLSLSKRRKEPKDLRGATTLARRPASRGERRQRAFPRRSPSRRAQRERVSARRSVVARFACGGGSDIVRPEEGRGQSDGHFIDMGRSLEIAKVDQAGKA